MLGGMLSEWAPLLVNVGVYAVKNKGLLFY